jgi:hypothetical protein
MMKSRTSLFVEAAVQAEKTISEMQWDTPGSSVWAKQPRPANMQQKGQILRFKPKTT